MTKQLANYRNPPVVEAVLAIRAAFKSAPSVDSLTSCAGSLSGRFPVQAPLRQTSFSFSFGPNVTTTPSVSDSANGFRLNSKDGQKVVQIQSDGILLSHLAPYKQWKNLLEDAENIWTVYARECKPDSVERISLRYVNRIQTDERAVNMEDYLQIYPQIPSGPKWSMSGTFLQIQMPLPAGSSPSAAVINVALGESDNLGNVSFILDIDCTTTTSLNPHSSLLWEEFAHLRQQKNEIFESAITNRTRGLFA